MTRALAILCVALVPLLPGAIKAQAGVTVDPRAISALPTPSLPELLSRMMQSPAQQLRATVIYMTDSQLRTVRIESNAQGWRGDALDGSSLTRNLAMESALQPALQSQLILALQQNYRVQVLGLDRVAERPTQRVMFLPNDGWRYGYALWLDLETGVVLRSELFNAQKQMLESMLISEFAALGKSELAFSEDSDPVFRVMNLPQGFQRVRVRNSGAATAQQQIYSDGIAAISVYMGAALNAQEGQYRRGALNIVSKRVRGPRGETDFLLLGDVPETTLLRLASGLEVLR